MITDKFYTFIDSVEQQDAAEINEGGSCRCYEHSIGCNVLIVVNGKRCQKGHAIENDTNYSCHCHRDEKKDQRSCQKVK